MTVNTLDGRGFRLQESSYANFHAVRNGADQAIALLLRYGDGRYNHFLSELYSIKAYSMLFLSEFYCSGIPFSTIDFERDYTYTRGYSSIEIWLMIEHIFDSAISLAGDSASLDQLSRIGSAKVKMNLDKYEQAADILHTVDETVEYVLLQSHTSPIFSNSFDLSRYSVSNKEGINGLDFRNNDPRITYLFLGMSSQTGDSIFSPQKYLTTSNPSIVFTSNLHRLLMLAEITFLSGSDSWIDILNDIRTDGSYSVNMTSDTTWNKGKGGVAGLAPLFLPTNRSQSLDLIFRERAFWLYLTGNRQSDLRKLIRQYGREPETLYPTGFYSTIGASMDTKYGDRIVLQVPQQEIDQNPMYSGCIHEGA